MEILLFTKLIYVYINTQIELISMKMQSSNIWSLQSAPMLDSFPCSPSKFPFFTVLGANMKCSSCKNWGEVTVKESNNYKFADCVFSYVNIKILGHA